MASGGKGPEDAPVLRQRRQNLQTGLETGLRRGGVQRAWASGWMLLHALGLCPRRDQGGFKPRPLRPEVPILSALLSCSWMEGRELPGLGVLRPGQMASQWGCRGQAEGYPRVPFSS